MAYPTRPVHNQRDGEGEIVTDQAEILVLLVEDSEEVQTGMQAMLHASGAMIVPALTTAEAKRLFQESPRKFDIIVVDGCVDARYAEEPDTLELIQWFRDQGYTGHLVAWATNPYHRQQQLRAGCDAEIEKYYLPRFVERTFCTSISTNPPPC